MSLMFKRKGSLWRWPRATTARIRSDGNTAVASNGLLRKRGGERLRSCYQAGPCGFGIRHQFSRRRCITSCPRIAFRRSKLAGPGAAQIEAMLDAGTSRVAALQADHLRAALRSIPEAPKPIEPCRGCVRVSSTKKQKIIGRPTGCDHKPPPRKSGAAPRWAARWRSRPQAHAPPLPQDG